jgi:hypothetical protein
LLAIHQQTTNTFVAARKVTRRFFGVRLFATLSFVNFGEYSSMSFRHGLREPRFTRMFPDASLRTWMPAVHAGMTDAMP